MATNPQGFSSAAAALGMDPLASQVKDETDEEKKKKQKGMSMMQSPAAQMLLGGGMGGIGGL